MKTIHVICVLLAGLVACTEEVRPVKNAEPVVAFDDDREAFTTAVNVPFSLKATVTTDGRVSSNWFVDGLLESATPEFTRTFTAPGTYTVRYEARNGSGEFSREFTVTVTDVLRVVLSTGDSTRVRRKQLDELLLMAIVESGAGVTHQWTIDDTPVSTAALLEGFMLDDARDYSVRYTGANGAGSVERVLVVEAIERPLEIVFSETGTTLSRTIDDLLTITANVLYGGSGITHEWRVDNVITSTEATLQYTCDAAGTFAVTYLGVNGVGESVSRSYTLNVSEGSYMIDTFEDLTTVPSRYVSVNSPGLSIIANPFPGGINTSGKVMNNAVSGSAGTSGYFDISLTGIPDLALYKGIRFKIYRKAGNDYYPHIKYNKSGDNKPPVTMPTKFDEWEYIEFRFPAGTAYTAHQIRPLSTSSGANITNVGDRTILMDDFELVR